MRIIAFIEKREVIKRILRCPSIQDDIPEQHAHGPPAEPAEVEVPIVYQPFFDDLSTLEEQMELSQAMNQISKNSLVRMGEVCLRLALLLRFQGR